MISLRSHEFVERLVEVDGESLELVGKESTLSVAIGRAGLSWWYRRPASVRSGSSESTIRDHVMIVRLVAALILVLPIARRYFNG